MDEKIVKKLKIVFWPADQEYHQIRAEFDERTRAIVEGALRDCYERLKIRVSYDSEQQAQRLGEAEMDARIEYSLKIIQVDHPPRSNDRLVEMIRVFMTNLYYNYERAKHHPTIYSAVVLSNKEFFNVDFNSANLNLCTRSCAFVNLRERSLPLVHRQVRVTQDPRRIMERAYGKQVAHPMLTDFEHDRRQFVLRFPYFNRLVSLIVQYKEIKRMIASFKRDNGEQQNLELYFHLSSPPVIRLEKFFSKGTTTMLNRKGARFRSWDLNDQRLDEEVAESPMMRVVLFGLNNDECCQLLNRLAMCTERPIEFRAFAEEKFYSYVQSPLENQECLRMCENNYKLLYMIAALFSRGAIVKDYLLASEATRDQFVRRCAEHFRRDEALTLEVLEQVLSEIDKRLDSVHPLHIYEWVRQRVSQNINAMRTIRDDMTREGYVRVRKVVITPTRMLFVAPELLMGNRVLRLLRDEYPWEKFLRVVFRDDDGQPVYANNVGNVLIDRFIGNKLSRDGIRVAGRHFNYFGSSNSQMRDNGCYFIEATFAEIENIRKQLGSFQIQSAPKMMSRIAQCFTQARETNIQLERRFYGTVHDYEGGKNSNGEPYNFSDGVGRISMATASKLSTELGLGDCMPSCFQFRFRGYKGVLSVDTKLDALRKWGELHGVVDNTNVEKRDCWLDLHVQFRPSQRKFKGPRSTQKLEIVKYSSPVPISLNRPVINILDQVSALQSQASHQRICNRIHQLMDLHLHALTRSLIDETKARNRLGEFPKVILYDQLTNLNLTNEPFFRSMITASVRASLKKLRCKLQIPIPTQLGRTMFGIVDESEQLQYGQVFVQYTKNCALKLPGPEANSIVLKGQQVMITKNPSIVAGDIRMFNAVDIPALHHLRDVVVFPRWGPRPHTDEMAGSDLDGDEYTVIWDEQLFLDRNEDAFDYTCTHNESEAIDEEDLRQKMADFFVHYIKQDSIGRIANAFLTNSDLYGINSDVCKNIAKKHMESVDFPKTGVPPRPLTTSWQEAKPATEVAPAQKTMPPERAERSPDFMEKNYAPSYVSSRLNGQLFRRAKEIDDILTTIATQQDEDGIIVVVDEQQLDPLIKWEGCDDPNIVELARRHYESYSANIQNILDTYGIKTEGELFSGHFVTLRNRISDKDSDDMSFYNTSNAIEQQLFSVFGRFRRQFFEHTSPLYDDGQMNNNEYEEVTVALQRFAKRNDGTKEMFRRVCVDPTDYYKRMACAYYKIAYDKNSSISRRRFFSFPWLAWDVIMAVRRSNAVNNGLMMQQQQRFSLDPLSDKLSEHINVYTKHLHNNFEEFMSPIDNPKRASPEEQQVYRNIQGYCKRYKGLSKLMFFCTEWATTHCSLLLLNGQQGNALVAAAAALMSPLHISILLIHCGLNHLPCEAIESQPCWLEQITPTDQQDYQQENVAAVINLEKQYGGLGKKFLLFMELLASRQFRTLPCVDCSEPGLGYRSVLDRQQLEALNKAALRTYHQIAFTLRLDSIPCTDDQHKTILVTAPQEREGDPFIIEVPASRQHMVIGNQRLLDKLCQHTGCSNIVFRALPKFNIYETTTVVRLYVSSTGAIEALNSLRVLLSVRAPPMNNIHHGDCRQAFTQMAEQLYDKLNNL